MNLSHAFVAFLALTGLVHAADPKPRPLRLFLLSGQSNMAGLNHTTTLLPALTAAYPNDEVVCIKVAHGGQPISRWITPAANPGPKQGDLYAKLVADAKTKLAGRKPASIAFVWMQGESDANPKLAEAYAENLHTLFRQLRADFQRTDIKIVIGRLSDCRNGNAGWDKIRATQVAVAAADPHVTWVDTDDLNGAKHDLHYDKPGYEELGRRFAKAAIELLAEKQSPPKPGHP